MRFKLLSAKAASSWEKSVDLRREPKNSPAPNAGNVKETVNSNVNTLIGNYMFYLDEINNEKSYSNVGLDIIAEGIDKYFTDLVNLYPNSYYDDLKEKIVLLSNKTKSENIKNSLLKLQKLIESKKKI